MKESRRWEDEEKATVAREYATADLNALAKKLGRTIAAVKRYAQSNGIKRPRHSTKGYTYKQRNPRPKKVKETPYVVLAQIVRLWP